MDFEKDHQPLLTATHSCCLKLYEETQKLRKENGDPYGYVILTMNLKTGGRVFLSNIGPPFCFMIMDKFLKNEGYTEPPVVTTEPSLYPQMIQSQN